MSSSMKDFLDKFFDLCREYQQEISLDKKDLSHDLKLKELEAYWNNECTGDSRNNHCKISCD